MGKARYTKNVPCGTVDTSVKNWKPRCSSVGGWVKTFWSHDGLLSGSNTNAQPFPCNDLSES